MNELQERIDWLEPVVKNYKKELRRLKTTVNKLEKLGIIPPTEIIVKKENIEVELKKFKQELKALKKVAELLKVTELIK